MNITKIWDNDLHNAFTDLTHYQGRFYCTFREGREHVSPEGFVRVLCSENGVVWQNAGLLSLEGADLRDPKFLILPDGRLIIYSAAVFRQNKGELKNIFSYSSDGANWSLPVEFGDVNRWLWRMKLFDQSLFALAYCPYEEPRHTRFYTGKDPLNLRCRVPSLVNQNYPNESDMVFSPDGKCTVLLRCDGQVPNGLVGQSVSPYTQWTWRVLEQRIGGPALIQLNDGRLIAAVRLYDERIRTSLCQLDAEKAVLNEIMTVPSGGDCSYAGLVEHNNSLWMSYYSAHEGRTAIYLVQLDLNELETCR